jgi:hypothetical protein
MIGKTLDRELVQAYSEEVTKSVKTIHPWCDVAVTLTETKDGLVAVGVIDMDYWDVFDLEKIDLMEVNWLEKLRAKVLPVLEEHAFELACVKLLIDEVDGFGDGESFFENQFGNAFEWEFTDKAAVSVSINVDFDKRVIKHAVQDKNNYYEWQKHQLNSIDDLKFVIRLVRKRHASFIADRIEDIKEMIRDLTRFDSFDLAEFDHYDLLDVLERLKSAGRRVGRR